MLAISVLIGLVAGLLAMAVDPTLRTAESRIGSIILGMTGAVMGSLLFLELAGPVYRSPVLGVGGAVLGASVALVLRPLISRDRVGVKRRAG